MTPDIIILDAVDEVGIVDSFLGMYGFNEKYTDKVLRDVYEHLQRFEDAALKLELYLIKILREEQEYGELIVPWVRKLHGAILQQLLDQQIYRQDGVLPYRYERRLGNRTLFLSLKGAPRGVIAYRLSGLPR
jgi:hypothetical protein